MNNTNNDNFTEQNLQNTDGIEQDKLPKHIASNTTSELSDEELLALYNNRFKSVEQDTSLNVSNNKQNQEELFIANPPKKQSHGKRWIILLILISIVTVSILLILHFIIGKNNYEKGLSARESGNYEIALNLMNKTFFYGDFETQIEGIQFESSKQSTYDEAIKLREQHKYNKAIESFKSIKDFKDAISQIDITVNAQSDAIERMSSIAKARASADINCQNDWYTFAKNHCIARQETQYIHPIWGESRIYIITAGNDTEFDSCSTRDLDFVCSPGEMIPMAHPCTQCGGTGMDVLYKGIDLVIVGEDEQVKASRKLYGSFFALAGVDKNNNLFIGTSGSYYSIASWNVFHIEDDGNIITSINEGIIERTGECISGKLESNAGSSDKCDGIISINNSNDDGKYQLLSVTSISGKSDITQQYEYTDDGWEKSSLTANCRWISQDGGASDRTFEYVCDNAELEEIVNKNDKWGENYSPQNPDNLVYWYKGR